MFLHIGRFTKQVKEAYKNYRLDIGNINEGLLISSGHWMVWIKNQHVSNEIKAIVMLLAGTLPKPGEMFTVEKDKADPQYKIVDDYYLRLIMRNDLCMKLIVTPIMISEMYDIRMIQAPDRQIFGIRQEFLDMVDKGEIDFDGGEGTPTGPCFNGFITSGIYWYNDYGVVMISPIISKRVEIPAVLSLLHFREDGSIEKRYFREAINNAFTDTTLDDDGDGTGNPETEQPDKDTEDTDTERTE